jgi:hypothetical protein
VADQNLYDILTATAQSALTGDSRPGAELPDGARLLDRWSNKRYGAVLFWVDSDMGLHDWGMPSLEDVHFDWTRDGWHSNSGGGSSTATAPELLEDRGPGLHRLGGGGRDPLRLTIAIASPDVHTIQLRSQQGIADRAAGADGFCLFGITHTDAITYAHPLDAHGSQIGSEALLL